LFGDDYFLVYLTADRDGFEELQVRSNVSQRGESQLTTVADVEIRQKTAAEYQVEYTIVGE